MPIIKVRDITMYYEIHGQGEPLVLISGFSVDHTVWLEVVERLQAFYQVIIFDNRGAGQSDIPVGPYSIEAMSEDVVELCAQLDIKHAHFIGSSMGGFILQKLALSYPELVKSAIICNSSMTIHTCFHYFVNAQLELIKANAPREALIKASCCWAFSYRFLSLPGVFDALIQWGMNDPYPFTITGYEGQHAALDKFDSRDWAQKISVPTLVVGGDQDLIFLESSIKALAQKIPNSRYYCFSECGHVPFMEYPDEFAKVVRDFNDSGD